MVTKKTYQKKFPDVKIQKLQTEVVFSRKEVEETVIQMCNSMNLGLVYYEYTNRWIRIYTSGKMKKALDGMVQGAELLDPNTNQIFKVLSEAPYIVCGELCVEVELPNGKTDVYSCEYFID